MNGEKKTDRRDTKKVESKDLSDYLQGEEREREELRMTPRFLVRTTRWAVVIFCDVIHRRRSKT